MEINPAHGEQPVGSFSGVSHHFCWVLSLLHLSHGHNQTSQLEAAPCWRTTEEQATGGWHVDAKACSAMRSLQRARRGYAVDGLNHPKSESSIFHCSLCWARRVWRQEGKGGITQWLVHHPTQLSPSPMGGTGRDSQGRMAAFGWGLLLRSPERQGERGKDLNESMILSAPRTKHVLFLAVAVLELSASWQGASVTSGMTYPWGVCLWYSGYMYICFYSHQGAFMPVWAEEGGKVNLHWSNKPHLKQCLSHLTQDCRQLHRLFANHSCNLLLLAAEVWFCWQQEHILFPYLQGWTFPR